MSATLEGLNDGGSGSDVVAEKEEAARHYVCWDIISSG
tara:strand:+ start:463 stop:576 length:114 start_codon:yes stop_codon:yes gene_type:complete